MYQVLARKYRPRNFIELVGQNHVSRALTSALERGRLHHAYLFTGTRGVGKTTIARILAKCLNCETGITSTPCEVCATCKAVNEGRFIDLIEIDAASRTKVEDTRELLDNVPYAPTQGRFKVYLIDEVHMLSTHSFNALLKTLEEPPEHVKFLFATTDPQKLPITVISRCLQFTLRPLAVDEITSHLTTILDKEQIEADKDAIWQIAESAQGSLRDALSLTDQAIAYGQGAVHHQDVKEMLGLIDRTIIYDLILAIHQNQTARVSQLLMQFRQQALDVSLVLDQLISTLHELALLQYLPELSLKYSEEINQKILKLAKIVSAQDLQLYYQIACKGRSELQLSVTQEQGFEMCVLRLLAFRPLSIDEVTVHSSSQPSELQINQLPPAADSATDSSSRLEIQHTNNRIEPDLEGSGVISVISQEAESFEAEQVVNHATDDHQTAKTRQNKDVSSAVVEAEQENILVFNVNSDDIVGIEQNKTAVVLAAQDMPFFPVEEERQIANHQHIALPAERVEQADTCQPEPHQVTQPISDSSSEESSLDALADDESTPLIDLSIHTNEHKVQVTSAANDLEVMPQDILKLAEQELEGEWTLEKWEYWFRTSQLSPAVQELAQYGLMSGYIDGISTFHIPQQYEGMLSQLQHALESEIKLRWPNTQFTVKYGKVDEITPYIKQIERKEKAFQRAIDLLQQNSVVKDLLNTFDGQLQNIQLK
ncbi:DNA polymerase III subunit gamma/tau [Acinetobacter baylyi]|uniref:DNA polymerase III subunit gamma/tau n=1 Tax=Acinetobacter baylyi TaxID=202950 RepID=UPI0031CF93A0